MSSIQIGCLLLLLLAAIGTIVVPPLILSAIGLGITSVILSILMYQLGATYAAVFELSVCAGLITVVFVSAISLTRRATVEEESRASLRHLRRSLWLFVITSIAALLVIVFYEPFRIPDVAKPESPIHVREALWNVRRFDILGQVLVLLAGIYAVVLFFKEPGSHGRNEDQ